MKDNYEKPQGLMQTLAISVILFLIASIFFFMAYAGLVSGAVPKFKSLGRPARGLPPNLTYGGDFTRKDNPERYWLGEGFFTVPALFFMGSGLGNLWLEYKRRQNQQHLSRKSNSGSTKVY